MWLLLFLGIRWFLSVVCSLSLSFPPLFSPSILLCFTSNCMRDKPRLQKKWREIVQWYGSSTQKTYTNSCFVLYVYSYFLFAVPFFCLSVALSTYPSFPSMDIFMYLFMYYLSMHVFTCLFVCLFICHLRILLHTCIHTYPNYTHIMSNDFALIYIYFFSNFYCINLPNNLISIYWPENSTGITGQVDDLEIEVIVFQQRS